MSTCSTAAFYTTAYHEVTKSTKFTEALWLNYLVFFVFSVSFVAP